ncbi:MAG TPA: multicopper oxidase domain-containing protein, partial [Actinomycetota bacterium]|nr:multicopper oxidase domain-containing protein [Actinomycetota bacterium]
MFKRTNALLAVLGLLMVAAAGFAARGLVSEPKAEAQTAPASTSAPATPATTNFVEVVLKEFAISPSTIQVPAGQPFVVHVMNEGAAQHTFAISVNGQELATPLLDPSGMANLNVPALDAGSYNAYCTVPGHKESGMTATVVAGDSAGSGSGTSGTSGNGSMPGMGSSSDQLGDGMTAQQMYDMHKKSMTDFPATTDGQGGAVLPFATMHGVKVFDLSVDEIQWEVAPGQVVTALGYDGAVPGPQIRVHQGDHIRINVKNNSPLPTTVHFHGVTVPNSMDGVPFVTQDPIMPGKSFSYEFTVKDPPGTYMYHSHFDSAEEVGRGLYGAFIVEPKHVTWDEEYTEILGDGPLGYTIDGKGWPATAPLAAELG